MDGIWIKRCPHCGSYIKKKDPEQSAMCTTCGWQERGNAFFCEMTDTFCLIAPRL